MAIKDDMEDVQEAVINELITENGITNTLADGQVTETKILNSAVTTPKIANGAVTAAKLGSDVDFTPAGGSITPAKLDRAYLPTTGGSVSGNLDVNGGIVCSPNTAGKDTFQLSTHAVDEGRLRIKNVDTTTVQIRAGGDSYFNGGNVGIGTSSPVRQLSLVKSGTNAEISLISDSNRQCSLLMGDGTSGTDVYRGYLQYDNTIDEMIIGTATQPRMRIQGDGLIVLSNVPTSAPSTSGAIWSDNGTLKIVT